MRTFNVIVACDVQTTGIGYNGQIPWSLPPDMRRFYEITTKTVSPANVNAVIMGRKTWESLKQRPLRGRLNIVVSSSSCPLTTSNDSIYPVQRADSFDDALGIAFTTPDVEQVFVIGGQRLYEEALSEPRCRTVYVTYVQLPKFFLDADTFFPVNVLKSPNGPFKLVSRSPCYREKDVPYSYAIYEKRDSVLKKINAT